MDSLNAPPPVASYRDLAKPALLECWEKKTHPDQIRLQHYLDGVEIVLGPVPPGPLVLALNVGLPQSAPLYSSGRDLDNFLIPVARRLGAGRLESVFGTKTHADRSTIAVAPVAGTVPCSEPRLVVRTHGSAQTTGWKDQIRDACIAARPTQTIGPVAVTVRFGVSARRNWTNLWKPAIDSLGPMLGEPVPGKRFEPSDDRIVRLDLHRVVRADLADDVLIEVWWQTGVPAAAESAP